MSTVPPITLREFLLNNFGLLLVALGIVLFKIPNHFVTGGVSGLAIIINHFFPDASLTGPAMTVVNLVLVGLGFAFLGPGFGWRTIYGSFALSFMVWGLDLLIPLKAPLTSDSLLELIYAIALPGIGSAIVFFQNSSTGGTDILAKILSTRTNLPVGKTLLISDVVIAGGSGLVFGVQACLYSLLGLALKAFLIDIVIENLNVHKKMEIISHKPDLVLDYILKDLARGATVYPVEGAWTGTSYRMIHTVVDRRQAWLIRQFLKEHDKDAFVNIITTTEIVGKGFRNPDT